VCRFSDQEVKDQGPANVKNLQKMAHVILRQCLQTSPNTQTLRLAVSSVKVDSQLIFKISMLSTPGRHSSLVNKMSSLTDHIRAI